MSDKKEKNQIDIFKSVKSEALTELTPELLESGLDLITESDVLKDIPVFGIGFKGYSLYKKITESFFTKKLLKFLIELNEIPLSDRENFINELESKNETNKAGEKLLITLNRLNDDEKATIIGKLFKKTIIGKLEYKDFNRLTYIIDNAYIEDLKLLENNYHLGYISDDIKSNLHQIGLIKQSISDVKRQKQFQIRVGGNGDDVQPKLIYKINDIGSKFIEFGFDK
ncbi:hypothetical protein Q2T41_18185 [Maribacter confluentis]|uniref:DUF4393 domain-containing protein n=1 Tax=Maribacter confluentis TaxID=1656093 RepID=A0ABT8RVN4_9FLAO|nr:hypothetical protein [Maribacter confluentis]MDO1514587.1 hypothetical protein [Maribacter confluentis]